MRGIVKIWQISTEHHGTGLSDVTVSFTIGYEDGQIISTELVFGKYNYSHSDILTCIQKYFKGELQFKR